MNYKDEYLTIVKIAERAESLGVSQSDRTSLLMDIDNANKAFKLRLQDLLESDDSNFIHDIVGIQNNINRRTKQFENFFLPRYAGEDNEE